MNIRPYIVCLAAILISVIYTHAQVPNVLNFQGRLVIGGAGFDGLGQFKFAIVSPDGSEIFWQNEDDIDADGEPDAAVIVPVQRGLYSVLLGDTSMANMGSLSSTVFENGDASLRVWFSDGIGPFQKLSPDQRIASVGFALMAADVTNLDATRITSGVVSEQRLPSFLSNITLVSDRADDPELISQGFVSFTRINAGDWETSGGINEPTARFGHSAIWTGQEMIVWGGSFSTSSFTDSGSLYRPEFDEWSALSPINAPGPRKGHSSVWTGQEMIVWGGASSLGFLDSGGRYDPVQTEWLQMSEADAPAERLGHIALWTGDRMIIWGGRNGAGLLDDGGIYDPVSNQWTPLSLPNPPSPRSEASAVWTGDRMIVWGGAGLSGVLNSGAQLTFDPNGNPLEWGSLSSNGAPSARVGHSAVWAEDSMILWGGQGATGLLDNGFAYDPILDAWTPTESQGAPTPRRGHASIWLGPVQNAIVIIGGETASGPTASGAALDLVDRIWRPLTLSGNPTPRAEASVIWTGSDLVLFGGKSNGAAVGATQRLNPQPDWYFYRKP